MSKLHHVQASGALVEEIDWVDPEAAFLPLAETNGALWLDSSKTDHPNGRFSFIAHAPYRIIEAGVDEARQGFAILEEALTAHSALWRDVPPEIDAALPPFRGGAAGLFGYDLGFGLEPALNHINLHETSPALRLGLYATVLAFDHVAERCFLIATGLPHETAAARADAARQAISDWQRKLIGVPSNVLPPPAPSPRPTKPPRSNFSAAQYQQSVADLVAHILNGDIFQANLAQKFTAHLADDDTALDYYRRLRREGPAPFAAFFNMGEQILASASPERFLSMYDGTVETRPIKGTEARHIDDAEDREIANALATSEKNRAENVMIVDLLRNDLAKNCALHSIEVPQLCALESFANVHHLVSTVRGKARQDVSAVAVLRDCFPGGSITGAPKIRAMQLIAAYEQIPRGASYGAIGYIGFDGRMDTNIIIRTALIEADQISFHVGGGIVADSQPQAEYIETLNKARGLMAALGFDTDGLIDSGENRSEAVA